MHAMVELLGLLLPLLRRLDAPLAAHLEAAGLGEGPPIFALAWLLTWFAHGVPALPAAARLFDAFLASHPLLPLYAAAAAMKARAGSPTWLLSDVDRLVLKYVWKRVVPYCATQKCGCPRWLATLTVPADVAVKASPVLLHACAAYFRS